MACKLVCSNCKRVLKEQGDAAKYAQGEYKVVYDEEKKENHALCLVCGHMSIDLNDEVQVFEISAKTGWTFEGSWRFWLIPFKMLDLIELKNKRPEVEILRIEKRIWEGMKKNAEWQNWYSPLSGGHGELAGLTIEVIK
jgi:hypothetical protein